MWQSGRDYAPTITSNMVDAGIIEVRARSEIEPAKHRAEAGVSRGKPVNVLGRRGDERWLVCRLIPSETTIMVITPEPRGTGRSMDVRSAVAKGFAVLAERFDG